MVDGGRILSLDNVCIVMCGFEAGNAKNDRRNTKLKKSIILTLGQNRFV